MINERNPATASPLSATWLRFTGKDLWTPITAVVFSCEWTSLPNQTDSEVGHYHVVYSYSVANERYVGRFVDYGLQQESYLHPGDTFTIRYDPSHPSRSYYPDLRTRRSFLLICAGIGAGLGLLVGAIAIARSILR
jgi:hypothetical protein